MSGEARGYAVRRLNPFLGVAQVVETEAGRALSVDAQNWELQLGADRPAGWGSLNEGRSERQFYRYGVWSAAEGLARYPVHPLFGPGDIRQAAQQLIDAVEDLASRLPFPLEDRCELWLLGAIDAMPLALLASVTRESLVPARAPGEWRAVSEPLGEGIEGRAGTGDFARLETMIRKRAGGGVAQWFARDADGSGTGLDRRVPSALAGRRISSDAFPELLIDERWCTPEEEAIVAEYVSWASARLLTLPLRPETRARVERAACGRAAEVARHFRLYPEVADAHLIERLRVQARIAASAGPAPGAAE